MFQGATPFALTAVGIVLLYLIALGTVVHILLIKRDHRAALGWIVVCLGFPGIGTLFYILFGINRIRTRARNWHSKGKWNLFPKDKIKTTIADLIKDHRDFPTETFRSLLKISKSVAIQKTEKDQMHTNCSVQMLVNGEEAYPQMLEAIENAKVSVYLSTYIFESNTTGQKFIEALAAAQKRGVDVKILVDGVGSLYSIPTAVHLLKKKRVRVAKFLPISKSLHLNLRNHRKILTTDGSLGFTGGMNIGDRHLIQKINNKKYVADIHFKVKGPVVGQLQDVFLEDWYFVTTETSKKEIFYDNAPKGQMICRGITAGPNEDLEKLRLIFTGALSCAKKNIRIMTPYFIPDTAMISALNNATLRGVDVEIILPEKNNLPYVKWASQAFFWEMLKYGVKIYYQEGVFVHSKMMVIDDFYSLIGSANLDPRSLRLNFEFNLEVYDKNFAESLTQHFNQAKHNSHEITLNEMDARPVLRKIRDSAARIFSPYM